MRGVSERPKENGERGRGGGGRVRVRERVIIIIIIRVYIYHALINAPSDHSHDTY